ncbi:MAG: TolC family protein [Deltaproteobacteria bacterium]|nr:MAG: TolC family protein [Deltaproteobacteria bacterium]
MTMRSGHIIIILITAVVSLFVVTNFCEAEETRITLDEVVREAKEKNPEILEAKERWLAAKSNIWQARTWPDPQFGIMWEDIPRGEYSLGEANMRTYSLSQKIPFPGKMTLKGRVANRSAQMDYQMYKTRELGIITEVKKAYFKLFFIHKSIEINQRNKDLLKKFASIAETKYAVGKAPQHDVLQAQVELSLLTDELITFEQEKDAAEARLNAILNRPALSPLGKPEEWEAVPLKLEYEDLEKLALENRPELKRMDYAVERSKSALNLARADFLPDFTLTYRWSEMPPGTDWDKWDVLLMMDIPLWFWKQSYGVSEARSEKNRAEAGYQAMKNMVLFQVQDALVRVDSSWRRASLFKTSILPQAEQTIRAAGIAYETEKVDFLTLIRSQKMYQDAELKYYNSLMEYGQNLADLEVIVGIDLVE